jgi:hypothetical protein
MQFVTTKKRKLEIGVAWREGCTMEQLCEVRIRILLEKSADLQNRMAGIWTLRKAVRTSEAMLPGPEPIRPAVVAPLVTVSDIGSPTRKPPLIGQSAN